MSATGKLTQLLTGEVSGPLSKRVRRPAQKLLTGSVSSEIIEAPLPVEKIRALEGELLALPPGQAQEAQQELLKLRSPDPTLRIEAAGKLNALKQESPLIAEKPDKVKKAAAVAAGATMLAPSTTDEANKTLAPQPKPEPIAKFEKKPEEEAAKKKGSIASILKTPEDIDVVAKQAAASSPQGTEDPMFKELTQARKDYVTAYKQALADAKNEKEKKDTITAFAGLFEKLGLAAATFFAARRGAEIGVDASAGVRQLKPSDWDSAFSRNMEEYKSALASAGKIMETEMKEDETLYDRLRRERERREDVALKEKLIKEERDFQREKLAAEQTFRSQESEAERRFRAAEAEKERKARLQLGELRLDALAQNKALSADSKAKVAAAKVDQTKMKAAAQLNGALEALIKKDSPEARKQLANAATILNIPQEEVDLMIKEGTGEGFFNLKDADVARQAAAKYTSQVGQPPNSAIPPTAPSVPTQATTPPVLVKSKTSGKFFVRLPDGSMREATPQEIQMAGAQ